LRSLDELSDQLSAIIRVLWNLCLFNLIYHFKILTSSY
jgi:hypothetical protein